RWTTNAQYSASSCYRMMFAGSTTAPFWKIIWRSWAPLNVKFFLWLASQNRCWTADRLAKRGLQHPPVCCLCSQEEESLQ
uniref:Reverse transcriptase zinc-binding domain-containing protein n=1 Tax=Aegilops tauschii subsp. strangulata TaxID=200361 RepID=A0A453FCJ1_AEGTS